MVGEEGVDERRVLGVDLGCGRTREELGEGVVVGSKEGDVGRVGQLADDVWVEAEVLGQVGEVWVAADGGGQVHHLRGRQRRESREREERGVHRGRR